MANTKPRYTVQQVADALRATKGMVYLAAQQLGCTHQTVYNYLARHPTLKALHEAESERVGDMAELQLYNKIIAGELDAVKFYLRTKGKHRGYVERHEQTGADGNELSFVVRLPSKPASADAWAQTHQNGQTQEPQRAD